MTNANSMQTARQKIASSIGDDSLASTALKIGSDADFVASMVTDWLATDHQRKNDDGSDACNAEGVRIVDIPEGAKTRVETIYDLCEAIERLGLSLARELAGLDRWQASQTETGEAAGRP